MAGAPLAVADQYDTIGNNLSYYTNPEILALKKEGFVGKPIYYNGTPFEPEYSGQPDTGSRDSERWIGQTSKGDWVVALFNRSDSTVTKSIDFESILGLSYGGYVHDVWKHTNLGSMTSYSVSLQPHDVSMIIISPDRTNATAIRYEAEVASYQNGAHFNNDHTGCSGEGFVDQLSGEHTGADVLFGVYADYTGSHRITMRYANATGAASSATVKVKSETNAQVDTAVLSLPTLSSWDDWGTASVSVELNQGLNLISVGRETTDTGAFNLDCIDVYMAEINNAGFETGTITGWAAEGNNYGIDNSDAYRGDYKCYFWSENEFDQRISQTVSLPNGTYLVSAMVKQDTGTPNVCRMELGGFGGTTKNISIPHSSSYQQITGTVSVTTGQLTIAFYENADGNANLQIDEIAIVPCMDTENFGFETGTISGWTAIGNSYGVDGSDTYQGDYKCYFWNSSVFEQKLLKNYTGIPNGLHTVTAWVKQDSGNPAICQMSVSGYGGPTVNSIVPHGNSYVQISATVYVTNNQLCLTFLENGSNCNLQIDNVAIR